MLLHAGFLRLDLPARVLLRVQQLSEAAVLFTFSFSMHFASLLLHYLELVSCRGFSCSSAIAHWVPISFICFKPHCLISHFHTLN